MSLGFSDWYRDAPFITVDPTKDFAAWYADAPVIGQNDPNISSFFDSLNISDSIIVNNARAFSDALTLNDVLSRTIPLALSDSLNENDAITKSVQKAFTETLVFNDSFQQLAKFLTDALTLGENVLDLYFFHGLPTGRPPRHRPPRDHSGDEEDEVPLQTESEFVVIKGTANIHEKQPATSTSFSEDS